MIIAKSTSRLLELEKLELKLKLLELELELCELEQLEMNYLHKKLYNITEIIRPANKAVDLGIPNILMKLRLTART